MLGNTLAASLIWGINTIFLLDAGLSNLEAFAANAFFTAGMVLFEVPTGIVADMWGRRISFLLGTVTLAVTTGAVRAALADARAVLAVGGRLGAARPGLHVLLRRDRGLAGRRAGATTVRRRPWRRCSRRGQVISGVGMLDRLRRRRLPRPADQPRRAVRGPRRRARGDVRGRVRPDARHRLHARSATAGRSPRWARSSADSVEYGWRVPAVRYLMLAGAVHRRRRRSTSSTRCSRTCSSCRGDPTPTASPVWPPPIVAGAQIVGGLHRAVGPAAVPPPHVGAAARGGPGRGGRAARRPGRELLGRSSC